MPIKLIAFVKDEDEIEPILLYVTKYVAAAVAGILVKTAIDKAWHRPTPTMIDTTATEEHHLD